MPKTTTYPPRGWNSFDSYGAYCHEAAAFANLETFAEKLVPHGYEFFTLDIAWYAEYPLRPGTLFPAVGRANDIHLDAWGRPLPSKAYFPNGFEKLIARAHELGIKFGLHLMRGIPRQAVRANLPILDTAYGAADVANPDDVCAWGDEFMWGMHHRHPGAQAYYDSLIGLMAKWGVDFLKYDDITNHPLDMRAVRTAIERSGRPIVLSLSPGNQVQPANAADYQPGDTVRITGDVWDKRCYLDLSLKAWEAWTEVPDPNFWIDLDMIPFGKLKVMNPPQLQGPEMENDAAFAGVGTARDSQLTLPQKRTFMTMQALAASPLIMGGDLPQTPEEDFALITHPDILACNANGVIGHKVAQLDPLQIWHSPDRSIPGAGWIAVFNRSESENASLDTAAITRIPKTPAKWREAWSAKSWDALPSKLTIEPDDSLLFRYES